MGFINRSKSKPLTPHQEQTYEQKLSNIKQTIYQIANAHLIENQNNSPFLYYICLMLQHLALLWFVLHPGLNIFDDVYLLGQLRMALQLLNFQQYMKDNHEMYKTLISIIMAYLTCQIVFICISSYSILNRSGRQFAKYIKKIVNFQVILNVKVLSGPIIAVCVNVLYCQDGSPYRISSMCYQPAHIVFCILSAIILLLILAQILIFGVFYFIKNPLTTSYMGDFSRYYTLSKAIIKILLPVYFAVDYSQSLSIVYVFLVTALFGLYIVWHRLFSMHSYQQQHFYVQYFMESIVFWMAANNILSYYIEGPNTSQPMSLVYSLFSAILIAILLMNIQKTAEDKFIQECLEKKLKKQNMERFIFILINRFLHQTSKQAKLTFKVYSKIISKNIERYKEIEEKLYQINERSQKQEIYHFLCILIESCLEQNNSVILKTIKCYLLCYLGQKSFGLHQSLQLQEERLGLADEFMLYEFKINQNVFGNEKAEKFGAEFVKYYRFHEQLGELEELIQLCAQNNLEYWDELCQGDPSIAKLRNLATFYNNYQSKISSQYAKVIGVFPQNLYSTNLYLKFLMNVGVDTKEALAIKEKLATILQASSRSVRVSECQFSQDEDVAIVTVDSIGNNLGVVLNCNNNVQQSLGFQKTGFIGKNVTKIMPKIYSQLHNNFMLKFIRSQTSHLRPSDKIVTALNKDSLLVEIKLTVRMMTSSQSALTIVGFMKKIVKEKNDIETGLLMFSLNSSEILGIDAQFEKLMNYKLSGKQLVQEQIKLASIMPQLNLQLLEKQQTAHTVLEVGNANEQQQSDIQVTKHIKIQLKSTKLYQGIKIGFVTITQDKLKQTLNLNAQINLSLRKITKTMTPDLIAMMGPKKPTPKDQISINLKINDVKEHVEDGLTRELPMAKKIEQYISNKQNTKVKSFINFIHILTILGCAGLITFIYLSHRSNLSGMGSMYRQMNTMSSLPYYISRVNLLTNLIWSAQNDQTQPNYSTWIPIFTSDFIALKSTFYSLIKITNQYKEDLQYNKLKNYGCKFIATIKGALVPFSVTTSNMNIFNGYMQSAGQFTYANYSDPLSFHNLLIQSLIIRLNGDQIIPNIADNAVILYQNLMNSNINAEFTRMAGLKGIFLASSVVILFLISIIGSYINKINQQVVDIYKKIRLWDITELSSKCSGFLAAKGCKVTKRRNSSLLRIFPFKSFIDIIANTTQEKKSSFNEQSKIKQMAESMSFRQAMSPDPLMTPIPMTPAEHGIGQDNEQTLLKGNEAQPTIQMYWQSNNLWIVLGMILIFLIIGGVVGLSIYTLSANSNEISSRIQILQKIGKIRKIINFINYLSFRTLEKPNDSAIRTLLNKYISQFYQYSGALYPYLGDPQPVLKNVYTYVQTIQQWLANPNISSTNILLANYQKIYDGLKMGSDKIDFLNTNLFQPQYNIAISDDQQTELTYSIILFLIVCFFILFLDCIFLKPIYRQSKHSINMIKILPAWIFQRNSQALDHLAH